MALIQSYTTTAEEKCLHQQCVHNHVPSGKGAASTYMHTCKGKESGKVSIKFLFHVPGFWHSNQISERALHHHFCEGLK